MNVAGIPLRLSESTWSFINAMSGDDERQTFELQRGKLIDERFPRARRHDGKRVLFVEERLNGFCLSRAEGGEAKVGVEGGGKVFHSLS